MLSSPINQTGLTEANPTVSVIIPAYKVARFVRETLESVFAQTFIDLEAIVINDDSPNPPQLQQELEKFRGAITYLQATVEVLRGKQELATGDFTKAAESFTKANRHWPSKKLQMVLICLRIAPRALQRIYQIRSN